MANLTTQRHASILNAFVPTYARHTRDVHNYLMQRGESIPGYVSADLSTFKMFPRAVIPDGDNATHAMIQAHLSGNQYVPNVNNDTTADKYLLAANLDPNSINYDVDGASLNLEGLSGEQFFSPTDAAQLFHYSKSTQYMNGNYTSDMVLGAHMKGRKAYNQAILTRKLQQKPAPPSRQTAGVIDRDKAEGEENQHSHLGTAHGLTKQGLHGVKRETSQHRLDDVKKGNTFYTAPQRRIDNDDAPSYSAPGFPDTNIPTGRPAAYNTNYGAYVNRHPSILDNESRFLSVVQPPDNAVPNPAPAPSVESTIRNRLRHIRDQLDIYRGNHTEDGQRTYEAYQDQEQRIESQLRKHHRAGDKSAVAPNEVPASITPARERAPTSSLFERTKQRIAASDFPEDEDLETTLKRAHAQMKRYQGAEDAAGAEIFENARQLALDTAYEIESRKIQLRTPTLSRLASRLASARPENASSLFHAPPENQLDLTQSQLDAHLANIPPPHHSAANSIIQRSIPRPALQPTPVASPRDSALNQLAVPETVNREDLLNQAFRNDDGENQSDNAEDDEAEIDQKDNIEYAIRHAHGEIELSAKNPQDVLKQMFANLAKKDLIRLNVQQQRHKETYPHLYGLNAKPQQASHAPLAEEHEPLNVAPDQIQAPAELEPEVADDPINIGNEINAPAEDKLLPLGETTAPLPELPPLSGTSHQDFRSKKPIDDEDYDAEHIKRPKFESVSHNPFDDEILQAPLPTDRYPFTEGTSQISTKRQIKKHIKRLEPPKASKVKFDFTFRKRVKEFTARPQVAQQDLPLLPIASQLDPTSTTTLPAIIPAPAEIPPDAASKKKLKATRKNQVDVLREESERFIGSAPLESRRGRLSLAGPLTGVAPPSLDLNPLLSNGLTVSETRTRQKLFLKTLFNNDPDELARAQEGLSALDRKGTSTLRTVLEKSLNRQDTDIPPNPSHAEAAEDFDEQPPLEEKPVPITKKKSSKKGSKKT